MTPPPQGPGEAQLAEQLRYISDLIGFRRVIRQNTRDSKLTDPPSPWQILYLADTNVLKLCFDPHGNGELTRPFRFLSKHQERDTGIAIITAQFLLKGRLPGRRQAPLFVTPWHWSEFSRQFQKIVTDMTAARRSLDDQARGRLGKTIAAVSKKIRDATTFRDLRRIYDDEIQGLYVDGNLDLFARPKMLAGVLRDNDLIRPLRSAPYISNDLISQVETGHDRVGFWQERLMTAHRQRHTPEDQLRNVHADAKSLAAVELLNQDLKDRDVPVKVLLLTADRAIYDVTLRSREAETYHFVRDVRQFIPLINSRDLSGQETAKRVTGEICLAIDAFLDQGSPNRTAPFAAKGAVALDQSLRSFARNLLWIARKAPSRGSESLKAYYEELAKEQFNPFLGPELHNLIESVGQKWGELVDSSRKRHSKLIADYYREWLQEITKTFAELNRDTRVKLRQMAVEDTRELTEELTCLHLESTLLSDLLSFGRATAKTWGTVPRGLALPGAEAADDKVARNAARIVEVAMQGGSGDVQTATMNLCSLPKTEPAEIALACSAVALQLGRLPTAQGLAEFTGALAGHNLPRGQAGSGALIVARGQLIGAMAQRLARLQASADSAADCGAFDIRTLLSDCERAQKTLREAQADPDTAAVLAEMAALRASSLIVASLANDPSIRPSQQDLVLLAQNAHAAFDLGQTIPETEIDFCGSPIGPAALTVAATALAQAVLAAKLLKIPLPSILTFHLPMALGHLTASNAPRLRHLAALAAEAAGRSNGLTADPAPEPKAALDPAPGGLPLEIALVTRVMESR